MTINVVVVGARGHTGAALLPLLHRHPHCQLIAVGSSSVAGEPLKRHVEGMDGCELEFADINPGNLDEYPADLFVLALANGRARNYVDAIESFHEGAVIIDLSADYRFDESWVYGQAERFEADISGAKRIANPGCYATGAQLGLAPLAGRMASRPVVFGVSGYSGAGKTPSRRNNPDLLKDNLMPYTLVDHVHEQEVSRHLGEPVRFLPHVASFFRGISLTIAAELAEPMSAGQLQSLYTDYYQGFPLISVRKEIPEVQEVRNTHGVIIGGFSCSVSEPEQVSLVVVLDNLLKGAATQVVQNLNLAFALPPLTGLEDDQNQHGEVGHG